MGDAPPVGGAVRPPPAEGAMLPPVDAGAAPPAAFGPPSLSADPPEANFPAGGGVSMHMLRNPSGVRLASKVKSTNNNEYRLRPVYGFVCAASGAALEIIRTAGPPKEEEGAPLGEITLPLKAT